MASSLLSVFADSFQQHLCDAIHSVIAAGTAQWQPEFRGGNHMNKSMMTGLLAGVGIAVAGGVVGLTLMNGDSSDQGEAAVVDVAEPAVAAPAPAPAVAAPARSVAAPAPAPARSQPVAAAPPPAPAAAPAPVEECWEEEVVVEAAPRDEKRIAGAAAGAVIGGALADRLGDGDDLVTAAGAAAGAFAGRRAQREYQENQTTVTTEVRCAPVGSR
jgi:uncharacterized protein YcfJ